MEKFLDYSQKGGNRLYVYGIYQLPTQFDVRFGGMVIFLEQLKARALQRGWSVGAMNITALTINGKLTNSSPIMAKLMSTSSMKNARTFLMEAQGRNLKPPRTTK